LVWKSLWITARGSRVERWAGRADIEDVDVIVRIPVPVRDPGAVSIGQLSDANLVVRLVGFFEKRGARRAPGLIAKFGNERPDSTADSRGRFLVVEPLVKLSEVAKRH
jgi:hypothetical protein